MSNPPREDRPRLIPQDLRIDYSRGTLVESGVLADPVAQFERWFDAAQAAGVTEANAMTLATAGASGVPSARVWVFHPPFLQSSTATGTQTVPPAPTLTVIVTEASRAPAWPVPWATA